MLHILRLCCNVHVASIRTGLEICWLATYSNCKCWLATYSNCKCWLATYFNWKCWLATYSNCKWFLNLEFLLLFQKIFIWNIRFTILEIFVQNVVAIGFQFVLRVLELLVKIINNCNSFIYCLRLILYLFYILQIHIMATLRCRTQSIFLVMQIYSSTTNDFWAVIALARFDACVFDYSQLIRYQELTLSCWLQPQHELLHHRFLLVQQKKKDE